MKSGLLKHTLTLEFKDGRYKQSLSNFSYYSSGSGEISFENKNMGFRKKIFKETNKNIRLLTLSLKEYLGSLSKIEEDW